MNEPDNTSRKATAAAADHLSAEPGGLLMRWLDGEASTADRARVTAHLAACPACVREVRVYRALFGRLRALPERPAPAYLASRITAAALADRRTRRRLRWFEVAGSAYAASAVAAVIALGLSPWRDDVLAAVRTVFGGAVTGTVNALVVMCDRLMWVLDAAVKARETSHQLLIPFAPLGRSLEVLAAQPELRVGTSLALVLTTALWWWFNHRRVRGPGRMNDVSAFL